MGHVMSRQTLETRDGCKLHYVSLGPQDGKLIVFLHGWSGRYGNLPPSPSPSESLARRPIITSEDRDVVWHRC